MVASSIFFYGKLSLELQNDRALHTYRNSSTFDSTCLHNWWPTFEQRMEPVYNSLVPVVDFNAEGVHQLDIMARPGLDHYVILNGKFAAKKGVEE
ncbi:hypothetical protein EYC80_006175 [Monilinia laxa]|uniref:Uncharacterized protein n=1 Tax=Monilinia laxa TaxID=61186 RepID=A0A5N6KGD5_MONLA|nr:hypothetical protein EYC80_006175 [Monilinia laxa]